MIQAVGLIVTGIGLLMIVVGLVMAWGEYRARRSTLGPSDVVNALAGLIRELRLLLNSLGDKPPSLVLFTFGFLLVVVGAIIAGLGGLA
ncbi:MAG TPA: hypothetical protein VFC00_20125 [Micromonosporaceae bacterium]|nr:hypothetical protein [Micromonosporaceae bacterium]